jgi:prepilin-type N-terminal cleavage/methylation domain-containing protein
MCRWKVNIEKTKSKNFESYSPFGFTLIELIAVILVLGVIALIATSTISGIIEKARKGAAEQSARSYLSGLHNYIVLSNANSDYRPLKSNSTYNITKNTTMGEEAYQPINSYVELKGYKPTGLDDYISLNSEYTISDGKLTINGYQITIKDDEITQSIKGEKIDIESLSLEMTNTSMEKGTSFTLNANISPSNASDQRLKYSSSDSSIVSVDPFGLVKAIKVGNATITVESLDNNQKKASLDISVISSATGITLNKTSTTISLGNSETLVATLAPSDTTTSGVNWSSSPTGIVNIANGVVTAIKVGTTTVTATTTNGKTASANITVDNPATSVTLNTTSATIYKGETVNLTASLVPSNSTTSSAVVWSSNANSVASVNTSGVVTALNPGTATITATTAN